MAATIHLTARQRFGLEVLLIQQEGRAGDLAVIVPILRQIQSDMEWRRAHLIFIEETGQITRWRSDFDHSITYPLVLERVDLEKLEFILKTWPKFTVGDLEWQDPLLKSVQHAHANYGKEEKT